MRLSHRRSGLTLVELLVVTVIFSGIMAALLVIFQATRDSQAGSSAGVYLQGEARRAFDAMARELREAGRIRRQGDLVGSADFTGQTQIDFQIDRGYDTAACGGTCWGDDTANSRWLHYLLSGTQLLRCSTANQADAVVVAGCRVMANDVQTFQVDYTHAQLSATLHLEVRKTSAQLRGGSAAVAPAPLLGRVKIRNSS